MNKDLKAKIEESAFTAVQAAYETKVSARLRLKPVHCRTGSL